MLKNILFLIVVFLSNIVQCITGFAGTVLAMPFSVILVGMDVAKPVLNVLGIAASVGVLFATRRSFNKKEFLKIICVMLPGLIVGELLGRHFSGNPEILYKSLGAIVILFAVMNSLMYFRNKELPQIKALNIALLVCSGIVHGMFVCGGPLLVTYASVKLRDTDEFCSTLSAVWIVLNTIMMISDISVGYFNRPTLLITAVSMLFLVAAIFVGNFLAKKMSKNVFMILTYALMVISGISLFLK